MAKKISELNSIASVSGSDILPIVDLSMNTTNKITIDEINESVNNKIGDITTLNTTDKTSVVNAVNEIVTNEDIVDITSQVTFNETVANTKVFKKGKMIIVQIQGQSKTHSANDVIASFPSQYRPSYQVVAPFTKNANAYGMITLTPTNGQLFVGAISSTSASGRIYANFTYYLD